ncbi:MAG: regulator, partial [bacterium]|nr:regulator [bacterium]
NWRGYFNQDSGLPSDFINFVKARSADEAWYCTDKGAGVVTDFKTNTWVVYTLDPKEHTGKAVIMRDREVLKTIDTGVNIPHNYTLAADVDGSDIWIGTSKGLAWGIGDTYYAGLRESQPETRATAGGE